MFSVYSEEMYHSQIVSCCFVANLCNPTLSHLALGVGVWSLESLGVGVSAGFTPQPYHLCIV